MKSSVENSIIYLLASVCFLIGIFLWRHQKTLDLNNQTPSEQYYYQLSHQLFQHFDNIKNSVQQVEQNSQSLISNAFLKIQKDTQDYLNQSSHQTQTSFFELQSKFTKVDQWQNQIQELGLKIHNLSKILDHSTHKGKFGELHLEILLKSLYPSSWVMCQHTLSNGTRVDCLLDFGEKFAKIPIDSKFPVQTFKLMMHHPNEAEYIKDFIQVIKKNIQDISSKYIIPGVTTDFAVMFVPSDAIFSRLIEIEDITAFAQEKKVLLSSPQTLYWLLTYMKKFLIDFRFKQSSEEIWDALSSLKEHHQLAKEAFQEAERKTQQVQKELKKIKNHMDQSESILESLWELKEKPQVDIEIPLELVASDPT